ncbi:MAG: MerR family transcriptional regulator [Candidatus Cloacimonadota bacterium]|nr:MerR family transcriptional regulator [Candidatus Cloacimonadota bacterium]
MKKVYYSIGEISNLLSLKKHTIRYWETEFKQLKPYHQRGGNRRYTSKDIVVLKKIKELLHIKKYTIKGVQNILKNEDMKDDFDSKLQTREALKNDIKDKIIKIKKELIALLN